jgi:monoamine oxidase
MKTTRRRSCIVIGGGLAGLAAAHRLTAHGWKVDVLESQGRFGGRVMSHRFEEAPDLVCELGGEWIGKSHRRMKRLCKTFGLKLLKHQYSSCFWDGATRSETFKPGAWCFPLEVKQSFDEFGAWFNSLDPKRDQALLRELDARDWWSQLEHFKFSLDDQLRRDLMDSTDFGESIRLSSAYLAATEYFGGNATDEMDFKISGGNHRLIDALAKAIGGRKGRRTKSNRIHKMMTVTRVDQGPKGVVVHARRSTTKRGNVRRYRADFCICTVPAHCLTKIRWKPALERDKRNAATELQYSRIMKTAVLYARRFWPQEKESGFSVFTGRASDFCFDSSFRQKGPFGILCSYAIGDKADDLASEPNENSIMKWITEDVVSAVRPPSDVNIAPIKIRKQPWQREPAIGGAYAFYRPGQWFTVRPALQRPHHRVRFAGEHLSEPWQGFMEGAVETGEAAADALIKSSP